MTPSKSRTYVQVARAENTDELRSRIVRVFTAAMVEAWLDDITLDGVAEAARTTRQTVIRFFGGKSGLLKASIAELKHEVGDTREQEAGSALEEIVRVTVGDHERFGDMAFRLLAVVDKYPDLVAPLEESRQNHKRWLAHTLAPSLTRLSAEESEHVLCECLVATDTYTWRLFRRHFGKTAAETEQAIVDMLKKSLGRNNRQRKAI